MTRRPRRPLPPLKALQVFEAAARRMSFSKAADELNVTPSAVSHQILLLEERLGTRLFDRRAGRVSLTESATSYAALLEQAFDLIMSATDAISPLEDERQLDLASGHSFAARWLQPNLSKFREANPDIQIRVQTFSKLAELEGRSVDVAICYGRPPHDQKNVEALLTERITPLCSPQLLDHTPLTDLRDLLNVTLIHSDNALSWKDYLSEFGIRMPESHHGFWLDRSTLALEAAAAGQGVVLESVFLAGSELRKGELIAPFQDREHSIERTSYYIAYGPNARRKIVARKFRDWIKASILESATRN